ncbi:MAG: 6-phosphofructokinase [Clostridia bacterium]|nr:6-phosphofructokinase [Oscillospiraceae bacterium]MBQ1955810.1 6-phosphofructokinase [Clostridia bacterium]
MEKKRMRRIGVLTSGGDAPGMNAAVRSVVRTCIQYGVTPIGIFRGYNGLINGDMDELNARSVNGLISKGGTMLYTARSPEFATPEGVKRAVDTCRYKGIDGLICIGGDGTFRGARDLAENGVNTIGIPGTIDNDIACTHYSIGFDTAANTALDAIDKLADTMQSHERCSVVEVMGRGAGHLALYVGLSVGATAVITPEKEFDFETDVAEKIREGKYHGKHHHLIIVAEGTGKTEEIARLIRESTGMDCRVTIIGHVQRGGSPTARDRCMASRMGHYAVCRLLDGESNIVVAYRDSKICHLPISEALSMKKNLDDYMYQVASEIAI